jgi:hypothetical protein
MNVFEELSECECEYERMKVKVKDKSVCLFTSSCLLENASLDS